VKRAYRTAAAAVVVMGGLATGRVLFGESRPVAGKVSYMDGDVFRADKEEGPFRKLKLDGDLFEGDFLKTEESGRLEARLSDRSILRLAPGSRMRLEQARFSKSDEGEKKFTAKLMAGRLWAKVTSLFGDSKFEVATPNAVAGVRGTVFAVDRGADKSTTVKVFSGKVVVSNKPVFYQEGTKKFDGSQKPGERKQVAGPQEVSKKQWEESIAGALQQIRVAENGQLGSTEQIAQADSAKDEWIAWNQQRDSAAK
jgi:hypothetical protein